MMSRHPIVATGSILDWRPVVGLLAATMALNALAIDTPPFPPTPVVAFNAVSAKDKELRRLKISVASEDVADSQVRVGAVVACSRAKCFRAQTSGLVDLVTTAEGKSSVLLEAAVPVGEIDSLYFEPTVGAKTLVGSIRLRSPVYVEELLRGVEILVSVGRHRTKSGVEYRPVDFASSPFDADWQVIYYDPKFAVSVQMNCGSELTIPAMASRHPHILGILCQDVYQTYPQISIFPEFRLLIPASMTIRPMPRSAEEAATILHFDPGFIPKGAPDSRPFTDANGVIRIHVRNMATITPGAKEGPLKESGRPNAFQLN